MKNYRLEALKVDSLDLNGSSIEKSTIYTSIMTYEELIEICTLGNVSINREVDDERASQMVAYIGQSNAFYPPIVVATNKKNNLDYIETTKQLCIDIHEEDCKFIVIDGQHRFKSIEKLLKEESEDDKYTKRKQSVFIIDNANDFNQRKIFMDINNNSKKVKLGTKIRFEESIANYFGLYVLENIEGFTEYVVLDSDQATDNTKIPYKFIVKCMEKIVNVLEKEFRKERLRFEDIEKYNSIVLSIWKSIFILIQKAAENGYKITGIEKFYIVLGKNIQKLFENKQERQKIIGCIENLIENIECISEEFENANLKSISEKEQKIDSLIKVYFEV